MSNHERAGYGLVVGILMGVAPYRLLPQRDADFLAVSVLLAAVWLRYRSVRSR